MAILTLLHTLAISVFGELGLSVRDESLVDALVSIKVVVLLGLDAHHTELHVSLCWNSGGTP
jgi:hypothetical protein